MSQYIMGNIRIYFWTILLLTILAVLINIPQTIPVNFDLTIPAIHKTISIHNTFKGFDPSSLPRPFRITRNLDFRRGLDLEGGVSIIYKADTSGLPQAQRPNALEAAKTVIERRINLFGVSEPVIQTATVNGESRIIVELAGEKDVNQALQLIGTTAQLTFWETGNADKQASPAANLPLGAAETLGANPKKTDLTGKDLQEATVSFEQNTGKPQVQLVFNGDGAQKFAEITKRNVNKRVAIVLDNEVIEAPNVNEPILTGNAVISGGFTTQQANALAIQLRGGALPVPLSVLQQRTIGATLGESSLTKSLIAGLLGFVIIVIFMCALYGRLGVIASFALILYTLFVLAVFRLIPVTLTLAGIAGFILSIGMAVDANILIFERMREEMRRGKSKDIALELGFSRAWSSIRDSNASTLITSFILYEFGNGVVRGFALTLAIGVVISMFSAIVVTRTFLKLIYR